MNYLKKATPLHVFSIIRVFYIYFFILKFRCLTVALVVVFILFSFFPFHVFKCLMIANILVICYRTSIWIITCAKREENININNHLYIISPYLPCFPHSKPHQKKLKTLFSHGPQHIRWWWWRSAKQTKNQNKTNNRYWKQNWTEQTKNCGTNLCVCIISGVKELRLSHEQKAETINGDIDKLKLETIQPFQRPRRNWWLNAHANNQKDLLMNANGRYECPRSYCGKSYKEASSLQRHIRCVCLF